MSKIAAAKASINIAKVRLDAVSRKLIDVARLDPLPTDLPERLKALESELFEHVRTPLDRAEGELTLVTAAEFGEEAREAIAGLAGLFTTAHLVTQSDIDHADDAVRAAVEMYARRVDTGNVPMVDQTTLAERIEAFRMDVKNQTAFGKRISKVVSTVVGIGRTAVRLLA